MKTILVIFSLVSLVSAELEVRDLESLVKRLEYLELKEQYEEILKKGASISEIRNKFQSLPSDADQCQKIRYLALLFSGSTCKSSDNTRCTCKCDRYNDVTLDKRAYYSGYCSILNQVAKSSSGKFCVDQDKRKCWCVCQ
ncbi:DgyrCDS1313 [Dimorphilus gyrociliatus]|uniref:DgyrCDS1313 n=1 Tax=Dimorphilus gyrociliatus TaxID=2664684 RepID=A0A7I8V718_9ANNE|nr:DgyrCDS1313 [Dimorphilus gyrociliatus]